MPTSPGVPLAPRHWKGPEGPSPEPQREHSPVRCLDPGLQAPELWEEEFLQLQALCSWSWLRQPWRVLFSVVPQAS